MTLVIASQMEDAFNAALSDHATAPTVIPVPADEPWAAAGSADLLLVRPTPAWMDNRHRARPAAWPGRLRWVYSASAGIDFYPRWLLDAPLVTCGRGVASDEIADYVIGAIYRQAKDLDSARVRDVGAWRSVPLGRVVGTTLGIVGFGAIGVAVATRALALGMRVVAFRRRALPSPVAGVELVDDLSALIAASDHIVLALPATDATRALIGASALSHARPHAHVINVARGSVLDQDALVAALDAGRLGYATLDVTEPEPLPAGHPLWTHDRVRLTPHVAANYLAVRDALFDRISDNITRFARGETPTEVVDPVAGY